jgi:hypothetical protein
MGIYFPMSADGFLLMWFIIVNDLSTFYFALRKMKLS